MSLFESYNPEIMCLKWKHRVLMLCGDDPRANNKIFNLSNNCQLRTLIESITASLKWKPIKLYVPEVPLRILVSIFSRFISIPLRSSRIDALVNRTFYPTVFNRKNFRIYASIVHSRSDSWHVSFGSIVLRSKKNLHCRYRSLCAKYVYETSH